MNDDTSIESRAEQIGLRLSKLRLNRRLRLSEVAVILGIPASRYKSYEIGKLIPSLPELEVLSIHYNYPISSLLSQDEQLIEFNSMDPVQIKRFMQLRQRIIATQLRKAFDEADIPRKDIAEALGIKTGELSGFLNGKKPIPLALLEVMCRISAIAMQTLYGTQGAVGEMLSETERVSGFKRLPSELQEFIAQPINRPYMDLARRLSNLPVDKLRAIAEGLLDITF